MKIAVGDITALKNVEVIVNAANGKGPMGRGVAGAIGQAGGPGLRNAVRRICEANGGYKEGQHYVSPPGLMITQGIQAVYHAVTMEYPGGPTSYDVVGQSMRAVLEQAIADGRKSIAFPGLGTGVGQLDAQRVAKVMVRIAESYADRINITIIDINKEFIDFAKEAVSTEG
jgi:O-acetyl-ADP-ribose deacetylase (regulator of RNase III)